MDTINNKEVANEILKRIDVTEAVAVDPNKSYIVKVRFTDSVPARTIHDKLEVLQKVLSNVLNKFVILAEYRGTTITIGIDKENESIED